LLGGVGYGTPLGFCLSRQERLFGFGQGGVFCGKREGFAHDAALALAIDGGMRRVHKT
jgi:hypothetical protein